MSVRLEIELTWLGGIVEDDDRDAPPQEPIYELRVIAPGARDEEHEFDSCIELEAFIAERYPDATRASLPPASPDEAARLEKVFARLDDPQRFDPRHARAYFAGLLYQWSHPPETVARLRRALGLPPLPGR